MTDDDKETPKEEVKEQPKLSILEETKLTIEEFRKEREEMTKIRDELQQLRSDQLLAGTAGGRVELEPPKEETAAEYSKRVMSGGLNERKEEVAE